MSLRLTDINDIKSTVLVFNLLSTYDQETYPYGHPFDRLTLTLSAKGWTASIQWKSTTGARGTGETQLEAVNDAIAFAKKEWNVTIN
jgi:hypothetical protein